MKAEQVAKQVLADEYSDYKKNSWHYDRQYIMIIKAIKIYECLNSKEKTPIMQVREAFEPIQLGESSIINQAMELSSKKCAKKEKKSCITCVHWNPYGTGYCETVQLCVGYNAYTPKQETITGKEVSNEVLTKESLYIERIKNLQAIIRHCDSPASDNPRFEMVLDLTKRDKEFALAINLMSSQAQKDKKSDDSIKPTADIDDLRDELIAFCCECNIELPRDKDYIDLVDGYLKTR